MSHTILYSPKEVSEMLSKGDAIIVDVRDEEDFNKGHIPSAVNIPEIFTTLSMTTPEGIQEMQDIFTPLFRKAGISHDKTVIVYEDCLNTRYGGSCRGYFQFCLFGLKDVGILHGGLSKWLNDGLPVTTETTTPAPSTFEANIQKEFIATVNDMLSAIDNADIKLLDNRDEDEWRGVSSSPYGVDFAPRKGRLPGAHWIEWHKFMDADAEIPLFISPEETRALCAEAGLDVNDEIIIYCFKGARASNTYIALKIAGFNNIRNYYGSWNEWSRNPALPIDDEVLTA